jgi:hypothetical protein
MQHGQAIQLKTYDFKRPESDEERLRAVRKAGV